LKRKESRLASWKQESKIVSKPDRKIGKAGTRNAGTPGTNLFVARNPGNN
jgi:hypothetical protein